MASELLREFVRSRISLIKARLEAETSGAAVAGLGAGFWAREVSVLATKNMDKANINFKTFINNPL